MNDFYAGTKNQTDILKKWKSEKSRDELNKAIEEIQNDRGYKYGTDWLYKPISASTIEELKMLSEQLSSEFMAKGGEAGDFGGSEKGRIFVPSKITKDELQSIISGKSKVSNGDTIQSALSYIRREEGSNSINRGAESSIEEERLIEFIDKNNLWYSSELTPPDGLGRGGEHIVYEDPTDKDFILKTNNLNNYSSWSDYLINLLLNNTFFPDTSYELIGFKKNEHGDVLPVVRQYFVPEAIVADLKDAQRYLFNRGFQKVHPLSNAYRNFKLGVMIGDLHDRNVLLKNDTLFFIDTKFFLSLDVDYVYSKGGETGKYGMMNKVKSLIDLVGSDSRFLYERDRTYGMFVQGDKASANSFMSLLSLAQGMCKYVHPDKYKKLGIDKLNRQGRIEFQREFTEYYADKFPEWKEQNKMSGK